MRVELAGMKRWQHRFQDPLSFRGVNKNLLLVAMLARQLDHLQMCTRLRQHCFSMILRGFLGGDRDNRLPPILGAIGHHQPIRQGGRSVRNGVGPPAKIRVPRPAQSLLLSRHERKSRSVPPSAPGCFTLYGQEAAPPAYRDSLLSQAQHCLLSTLGCINLIMQLFSGNTGPSLRWT